MINNCKLIEFPKIHDPRGNLSFIEGERHIPFNIKRVFYLYDVPGGETRAGHANIQLEQVLIAMSGSFDVIVDDGFSKKTFVLNRSYIGLYIPGMIWREIKNFSSGAVCVVLSSDYYDPDDYFREYEEFSKAVEKE